MHPFQHITLAQYHVADMQATAGRRRLARRARLHRGARRQAPTSSAVADPIALRFLAPDPDERRPAA
jgi:hypothetical protein